MTQAFRQTTAGAGHFHEWKMSRRRNGRKLLKCGQSYEIKEGVLLLNLGQNQKGIEGKRKIFMYRKDSEKWLKHLDFIILDIICLQMAFVLAYVIRRRGLNIYGDVLYRNMAIFLGFADLVVIFMAGIMKSVLKRGHYKEFVTTLEQAVGVGALAIA